MSGAEILLEPGVIPRLLQGLWVTVWIAGVSVALSVPVGLIVGWLMTMKNPVVRVLTRIYLDFIRIMPQLALLFIAFWLQTEGLARTSSNRNAFVTGLNVLVVPLLAMLALGRRYGLALWAACAMALVGMTLMFHEDAPWNLGDTLTLASTLFYAVYILGLEE